MRAGADVHQEGKQSRVRDRGAGTAVLGKEVRGGLGDDSGAETGVEQGRLLEYLGEVF